MSLRTTWGTQPRVHRAACIPCCNTRKVSPSYLGVAPLRVAEYQLEEQVWEGPAGDGHPQGVAVGEIDLGLPSRRMLLGEVDLLLWAVQGPPVLQSPLQGAELGGTEPSGVTLFQPLDNCSCLQLALGIARSRGSISSSHTPSKGSGRVRHRRSVLVSDGSGPSVISAPSGRSSRPWPPPSPASFLPYVSASTM